MWSKNMRAYKVFYRKVPNSSISLEKCFSKSFVCFFLHIKRIFSNYATGRFARHVVCLIFKWTLLSCCCYCLLSMSMSLSSGEIKMNRSFNGWVICVCIVMYLLLPNQFISNFVKSNWNLFFFCFCLFVALNCRPADFLLFAKKI